MSIRKLFYYWFYKYYSFLERYDQTRWMSQTKAMIIVLALEIWFLASIIMYLQIVTFKYSGNIGPGLAIFLICALIITVITIPALGGDGWKQHIKEFDEWDAINNKGTWIVAIVTVVIFLNFLLSISLWRQLQGWDAW